MRKLFLLTYGYENLILLNNLEKAELFIVRPDMRNTFPKIRNTYSLIYDIESDITSNFNLIKYLNDIIIIMRWY